jgi:MFS family permease
MLSAGASEMAMSQWASYFAERGLGVTKVVGDLLGPCLFAVNMGLGRTLYGFFGEKINIKLGISACGCLSLVCFLVTVFVRNPVIALLGCAICGLGVSLLWPGVLSLTSAEFGKRSSPMLFAILALAGDVGCSVGPWLTGAVSDLYMSYSTSLNSANALRAGLLVASVFPFLIVITSVIMGCVSKKQKK